MNRANPKRSCITILSFVAAGAFAGCGAAPPTQANTPNAETAGPPLSASFDQPEGTASAAASASPSGAGALGAPCGSNEKGEESEGKSGADSSAPLGSAKAKPFALEGTLVYLEAGASELPDFSKLPSKGKLYATKLDVPARSFNSGFPGVSDRFEWFAIDYRGVFSAPVAGKYGFSLLSDDGSKLLVDGKVVIDNDGVHPPSETSGEAELTPGAHSIEVQYFQGPREQIALVFRWRLPGQKEFAAYDTFKAAPAEITERPGAVRITLNSDVLFDTGKYDLKPPAIEALRVAKQTAIDPRPSGRVTVEGHTDDVGSDASNQTLSDQRARSVASWLSANGIEASRIRERGYGEKAPRVPNDSAEHRQTNRRVEIVIQGCPGK